jgi:hypothetical protein
MNRGDSGNLDLPAASFSSRNRYKERDMAGYAGARLKIHRANQHIADLKAAVGALPDRYSSTIEIDHNIPAQSIKYDFPEAQLLIQQAALITGDAIHNLKTALDYAWMVTMQRLAPAVPRNKFTKFPVRDSATELEHALRGAKIDLASPPLFNCVLSQIKPYSAGNKLVFSLHRLDIADKHHLLLPLITHSGIEDIEVENEMGVRVRGGTYLIEGDGPYYVTFRMEHKIHNKGKLSAHIVLNDGSLLKGLEVSDALNLLSNQTLHVVETFEAIHHP